MDFSLSPEQILLQDNLRRLFGEKQPFSERKKLVLSLKPVSLVVWQAMAEMGLLSLAEEDDSRFETMIIMEEIGRALALVPYISSVIAAGGLMRAKPAFFTALKAAIPDNKIIIAALNDSQQFARIIQRGGKQILSGAKTLVSYGAFADYYLVVAMRDDSPAIVVLPATAPGISVKNYFMYDSTSSSNIEFDDVDINFAQSSDKNLGRFDPLAIEKEHLEHVEYSVKLALICEALGIMSEMSAITLEYLKVRKQFNVVLGSFQALQHRLVDMYLELEQARSITIFAVSCSTSNKPKRLAAIAAASQLVGLAARRIGEESIQLMGAIGMTDEHIISHYFRRLSIIITNLAIDSEKKEQLAKVAAFGLFA